MLPAPGEFHRYSSTSALSLQRATRQSPVPTASADIPGVLQWESRGTQGWRPGSSREAANHSHLQGAEPRALCFSPSVSLPQLQLVLVLYRRLHLRHGRQSEGHGGRGGAGLEARVFCVLQLPTPKMGLRLEPADCVV